MKVIIYTGDGGNINVVTPVYPEGQITPEEEDALVKRVQATDVPPNPDGTPRKSFIKDRDSAEVTRMGILFDSWKLDENGVIYWDQAAGINVMRDEFRSIRKPILERLDVAFMRALETGDTATLAEIAARKRALRDVTLIDLSQYDTPETLNAFIPEVLKEN